jgi:hypothetical protein
MEALTNPHQAHAYFVLPENDKPTKEPTIKLTPEQIEFFKTNGFLSIDHFIDENEVAYIRDQYDRVIDLIYLKIIYLVAFFSYSGLLLKLVENMEIFLIYLVKIPMIKKQLHHNSYGHQFMVKI